MLSVEKPQEKNYINIITAFIAANWREVFSRLSLPALGLAASYGVYSFARRFVPEFFAQVTAGSFELVFIGLALTTNLTPEQRHRARLISAGAVGVSVMFNWASGVIDTQVKPDEFFSGLNFWVKVGLALLHGAPLSILGYLVADLMLHSDAGNYLTKKAIGIINELQLRILALETSNKKLEENHSQLLAFSNELQASSKEIENSNKQLQSENNELGDRVGNLQLFTKTLEKDLNELQSLVTWLQSAGKPFEFVDGQFRELPAQLEIVPNPVAIDVSSLQVKIESLAACLQSRSVTSQASELLTLPAGAKFGMTEYKSELARILSEVAA